MRDSKPVDAIAFHRFGPYHFARVNAASRKLNIQGIQLSKETNVYDWDQTVSASSNICTISEDGNSRELTRTALLSLFDRKLQAESIRVMAINGWSDNGAFALMDWCTKKCIPIVLMSESNHHDHRRNLVKERVKKEIVGLCSSALVGGTLSKRYLASLGFDENDIFVGYDAVDNAHFELPAGADRKTIRNRIGIVRPYFLSSNRFVPKKNLKRLIEAYARYRTSSCAEANELWDLVLLGDGPLKGELISQIEDLELTSCVHLPGFQQYDQLPQYYWGAAAFVHTSLIEQWGLVINEAMAASLPILASNRCGSSYDLITSDETGWTFDPNDTDEISRLMTLVWSDPEIRSRVSRAGNLRISNWGLEKFASGIQKAIHRAIEIGPRSTITGRMAIKYLCR